MGANSYTVVTNDTRAARVTRVNRHEMQEVDAGSLAPTKTFDDELGFVAEVGRGTSDRNVTYFALKNTSGTTVYFYPNAAGNALQVSTVKP